MPLLVFPLLASKLLSSPVISPLCSFSLLAAPPAIRKQLTSAALPLHLRRHRPCRYELGSDGRIINTLTDPRVVSAHILGGGNGGGGGATKEGAGGASGADDVDTASGQASPSPSSSWSVKSLLRWIATREPAFHVLIDTGALVTGMENIEVAQARCFWHLLSDF